MPRPDTSRISGHLVGYAARRLSLAEGRHSEFGDLPMVEPRWLMLLSLFIHHQRGTRVTVQDLCDRSYVPQTTARRYLAELVEHKLVERRGDPADGRRALISLSHKTARQIAMVLAAELQAARGAIAIDPEPEA